MKVYLAAPFGRWVEAKAARAKVRAAGHACASEWIDVAEACGGRERLSEQNRGMLCDALYRNDHDLATSDAVVALLFDGEGGAMFGETRLAISFGMPVAWVGSREVADAYREGCHRVADVEQALRALEVQP